MGKQFETMNSRKFFLFIGILIACHSTAQNSEIYVYKGSSNGYITVIKDPRFDVLAAKQAEINKNAQKYIVKRVKGWRIQAVNSQSRDEANLVKADLLKRYPEEKTYLLYQAPNFRVRIGNFLKQSDAFPLRKLLSALYPNRGIYIVPDIIEVAPPPDDEEASE